MNGRGGNSLDSILARLIEYRPEFEDENGKGMRFGNIRIYLKDWKLYAMTAFAAGAIAVAIFLSHPEAVQKIQALLFP